MTCNDLNIKGLLPAYQGKMLSPADTGRIEKHLSGCEDCRTELSLLHMLSGEPVPDPGEAFWAAMPGRIFREVQAQQPPTMLQRLPGGRGWTIIPRWTWAAAAVFLVAAAFLLLDRPETPEIARTTVPENGSSYGDLLSSETVDMAELTDIEIDSVDLWATEELSLLREEVIDSFRTSTDISIDDRLAELNARELERLMSILDTQEEG
jgi:hypothetical protein